MYKYYYRIVLWAFCLISSFAGFGQRIPVVFHIISQNPGAITDAQIINAVADLNDAFAHTGIYGSGPGANTGISFCLAQIDPNGGNTNGITRTVSVLGDFDVDIEDGRMKNLVYWDPKAYCNIWLVDGLQSEIYPMYRCGAWTRMKESGYATTLYGSGYKDGIVATSFGTQLAHEMGHYLSLLHTFTIGNCTNNNCNTDGDGVCDTPPTAVFGGSCASPQNSCSSDTISGFAVDVADLNANFMSYSTCTNMFTDGQGKKMRDLLAGPRNSLLAVDKCNKLCSENILAGFTRDNWFPSTGSTINFTSTSTGGSTYQWTVDGVVAGGNSPNLVYSFPVNGKFAVTLKVYNGDPACYATYTDYIIVSCGVMARFYPDKRIIASKAPFLLDSILFTNRSVNATSWQWLMSNNKGMAEQVVSTSFHLNYVFDSSGTYAVRLIASNGPCADTTEYFNFNVEDPVIDGTVGLTSVECFQQTKIKLSVYVCNSGYATIPSGVPISFYDADPRTGFANKLDTTFILPDSILGQCCGKLYNIILDIKRIGLNTLYAVFNDNGNSIPWKLPNTLIQEKNFDNNIGSVTGFKFKVSIVPPSATMEPGDTLALIGQGTPGSIATYDWSTAQYISCTTCASPVFIAEENSEATKKLIAVSTNACIDSAFTVIKVPPADDFTVTIDAIECSKNDSLRATFTICNQFKRGTIPKGLKLSFYNADPASPSAQLMNPVFTVPIDVLNKCATYTHVFKGVGAQKIFAVVNDKGGVPLVLPNDTVSLEKDYTNNTTSFSYLPETVVLSPVDTTVIRMQPVTMKITSAIYNPASVTWLPDAPYTLSCVNCLAPVVQAKDSAMVKMQMLNPYGCLIRGEAKIKIIPPDMTIEIKDTRCYSNDRTLVKFRICMNNGYDSIFKGIPVSFYDGDPSAGNPQLLGNDFRTKRDYLVNCDTFSAVINTPANGIVYAAINDKGGGGAFPDKVSAETDYSNNLSNYFTQPFTVNLLPADTTIYRSASVQLRATYQGGVMSSAGWSPSTWLSCTNCLDPVAKPPFTQQYIISVTNEYACIAKDTALIKTYTDGKVNIPNAFTPNGDGKNDIFYVLGSLDIKQVREFAIYDRYGQKVFSANNVPANNPVYGWNGIVNGKSGGSGTYVYYITIDFADNSSQSLKGTITLIR
jgi:gliding motility-associated-like protein